MKTEQVKQKIEELNSARSAEVKGNQVWLETSDVKALVKKLKELSDVHLIVISGKDTGEQIELTYFFSIFFGKKNSETLVNAVLNVDKDDPVVPSITDEIPGAVLTEREKMEFLGTDFEGLPDKRNAFLPEGSPHVGREDND